LTFCPFGAPRTTYWIPNVCADDARHGFGLGKQLSAFAQGNAIGAGPRLLLGDLAGRKNSKGNDIDVIDTELLGEGGR
jgi:hypothetical protein